MSKSKRVIRFLQVAALLIAAGGVWWYENIYQASDAAESGSISSSDPGSEIVPKSEIDISMPAAAENKGNAKPVKTKSAKPAPTASTGKQSTQKGSTEKVNGYDRLIGTVMIDHRNNDGDSFFVRHGDREFELRLYYADAPEKYLSDRYEDQRRRVAEQARELGGLTVEETVAVGQAAKAHVAKILKGQSFSVFTKWERVYDGERFYGFVLLPDETEWLCEDLVENGLARIHTKGESTPDGQSYRDFKRNLERLELQAKSAHRGAWR